MIQIQAGNLFDSKAEALVNTVNTVIASKSRAGSSVGSRDDKEGLVDDDSTPSRSTRTITLMCPELMPAESRSADAPRALLLADGLYRTVFAKTSHGLVRGPSRWPVAAVVDSDHAGEDAGTLLDGVARSIPIVASVEDALATLEPRPTHAVVGVATVGGVLPDSVRAGLLAAARAGLVLVNGLHKFLADDEEISGLAAENGATILDIRKPRPTSELRFWTGEVLSLGVPRVAVLGMDCALGKRTTAGRLRAAIERAGHRAEMVFTGQTGWLQGYRFGFLFDATPNDFVSGELEGAILACAREISPDLILLEGQSGLRNPSGPCGAEMLLSGAAAGVVLLHAPGRRSYEGLDEAGPDGRGCPLPSISSEIELIRAYGVEVWAVALHTENLDADAAAQHRERLEAELGLPVVLPLRDEDIERLAATVIDRLGLAARGDAS